jgi:hypothetical protein
MIRTLAAAVLAVAMTSPASAAVVVNGSTPSSFQVLFDGNVASTPVAGLTAAMVFNFVNATNGGTRYNFNYTLTNTSSGPITASRVSGFGFNVSPNVTAAAATGVFDNAVLGGAFPNGVGTLDVCINGANTCQGGASFGPTLGNSQVGSFSIDFAQAQSAITFGSILVRYQSIEGTRLGNSGTGAGTPVVTAVPEP